MSAQFLTLLMGKAAFVLGPPTSDRCDLPDFRSTD